jgi:hypothetical protein
MARIKIKNLPKNMTVSKEEMKKISGGYGQVLNMIRDPWIVAGIVATAIAIPVALHPDDDVAS